MAPDKPSLQQARTPAAAPKPRLPNEVMAYLPPAAPYLPFGRRRRMLIGGCGIGTAVLILGSMLLADAEYLSAKLALGLADVPRCAAGETEGCVGGKTEVIVPPAASAASR